MRTYLEKEKKCETIFASYGPYWHAYTSGKDTPLLFVEESSYSLAMNIIAQGASIFADVKIIAFEVMGNHFHFIFSGDETKIYMLWKYINKRLSGAIPLMRDIKLFLKSINSLSSLRNNIVYTNRNGYVSNPSFTPFSYPWGTGRYYFLDWPSGKFFSDLLINEKRKMFRCRTPMLSSNWVVVNGYVLPCNYCFLDFGMALFRDAHHYFSMISKNVESYTEVALELDDVEFLTDNELYSRISSYIRTDYCVSSIKDLTKAQKYDLAKLIRREYRASNAQIRRVLALTQYEIDTIFPLGSVVK